MAIIEYFCPNGAQSQTPACPGSVVLNSAAWIASLWPGGVPAPLAALVAGLNLGSMLAADLCSLVPLDPGPFDASWLSPWNIAGDVGLIETWLYKTAVWYAWSNCCQCKTPPTGTMVPFAAVNSNPWGAGTEQIYLGLLPGGGPWNVRIDGQIAPNSGTQVGRCYFPTLNYYPLSITGTGQCSGYTGAGNDLASGWGAGPTCSAPNVPFNTFHTGAVGNIANNVPTCLRVKFSGGDASNTATLTGTVYDQLLGPSVYPSSSLPGPMPYQGPTGGTTTTPTYPPPTTTGIACQYSSRSAAGISDLLVPNGKAVLSAASHHGSGSIPIPATANGYSVNITASPPSTNHDAGDPPKLYQVGWLCPSPDGVEFNGPQRQITGSQQIWWDVSTLDAFLIYNIFPGFTVTVTFYSPAAAP